jgi:uncharacterized membrane protein YtjA (UPF0391 family)
MARAGCRDRFWPIYWINPPLLTRPRNIRFSPAFSGFKRKGHAMLKWALIFLVISIVAGFLGFSGVSAATASIAKVLFFLALLVFVIFLVLAIIGGSLVF